MSDNELLENMIAEIENPGNNVPEIRNEPSGEVDEPEPEKVPSKKKKDKHASQTKSSKAFQITLNEIAYWDLVKEYLCSLKDKTYIIACKEKAPSTGHEHIHCYVHFRRSVRLSLNKLHGAHIEKCFGSPQQNIAYIEKDGEIIYEEGERPKKGGVKIAEVKKMTKEQRDNLPFCYYKAVQQLNEKEANKINLDEWYKEVKVTYISGPSGAGKTRMARQMLKDEGYTHFNLVKYESPFWHGVSDDEEACIYDDWRDNQIKPTEFINFIDYNIHTFNVKGGSVQNKYKRIIITTVQSLDDIYRNVTDEPRRQWERRIKERITLSLPDN